MLNPPPHDRSDSDHLHRNCRTQAVLGSIGILTGGRARAWWRRRKQSASGEYRTSEWLPQTSAVV